MTSVVSGTLYMRPLKGRFQKYKRTINVSGLLTFPKLFFMINL